MTPAKSASTPSSGVRRTTPHFPTSAAQLKAASPSTPASIPVVESGMAAAVKPRSVSAARRAARGGPPVTLRRLAG